ncbi:MAG: BlaI/MecI/CopY family transcriptional regulator [Spirochaetales bacterium]|nr:BlaI/MecI/CopY family transcriptional regulator [Spirochaetales bacterium]
MTEADTIFGIMASLGREGYSVQALIRLAAPLGIAENTVRTTLHRMQKKGTIASRREGRQAVYHFTNKAVKISGNVLKGFHTPDWSGWDNLWRGIIYSVPETNKPLRHRIRTKLALYRYRPLYPGFWIRPYKENDDDPNDWTDDTKTACSDIVVFTPETPFAKKRIQELWQVEQVNRGMAGVCRQIQKEAAAAKSISPEEAFKRKIITGEKAVASLFSDPLLPDEYLPNDWNAVQLRILFQDFDAVMTKIAGPFISKILEEVEE